MPRSSGRKLRVDELVEAEVRGRLGAGFRVVQVEPDVDGDGDAILRVAVVYDEPDDQLDRSSMIGLTRHLRTALENSDSADAFPVVTYVSPEDWDGLKHGSG